MAYSRRFWCERAFTFTVRSHQKGSEYSARMFARVHTSLIVWKNIRRRSLSCERQCFFPPIHSQPWPREPPFYSLSVFTCCGSTRDVVLHRSSIRTVFPGCFSGIDFVWIRAEPLFFSVNASLGRQNYMLGGCVIKSLNQIN